MVSLSCCPTPELCHIAKRRYVHGQYPGHTRSHRAEQIVGGIIPVLSCSVQIMEQAADGYSGTDRGKRQIADCGNRPPLTTGRRVDWRMDSRLAWRASAALRLVRRRGNTCTSGHARCNAAVARLAPQVRCDSPPRIHAQRKSPAQTSDWRLHLVIHLTQLSGALRIHIRQREASIETRPTA
jgi:hypothetical protein